MNRKALVVLSGGQDSTTCLALAVAAFGAANVHTLTFNYGQRHARELQAAADVAFLCGIPQAQQEVLTIGSILAGKSPLTDHSQPLEQYSDYSSMDSIIGNRVELTFVPMRNALFLTLAANRAAVLDAGVIYTGVCQQDNANYPDCRELFIRAQELTINEALGYDYGDNRFIGIARPLMHMSKAESIRMLFGQGMDQLALLAFSHTAYDGQYPPLGRDHATVLREQGFLEAGIPDPLIVRAWMEGHFLNLPLAANYAGNEFGPRSSNLERLCAEISRYKGLLNARAFTRVGVGSLEDVHGSVAGIPLAGNIDGANYHGALGCASADSKVYGSLETGDNA